MITKVRLKNWKSHDDSELEFAAGTNGLVGIVGSGKTSILDGICFALFGTFPALQNRKLKLEDVIMKKPSVRDSAEAEVFFELDGDNYSVKRVIEKRRGTSYSEIRKNGSMLESPATKNVTAVVEKNLKVNYELFSKAIYSEQNAIDYFLTLGKGQRMKKIDELLMIDRFEKARANAVKLTNKIVERRIGRQSSIEQLDLKEAKKSMAELKRSIRESEGEQATLKAELKKISRSKTDANSDISELRAVMDRYEKLMREDSAIGSAIDATLDAIERVERSLKEVGEGEDVDMRSVMAMLKSHSDNIDDLGLLLKERQERYERIQKDMTASQTNIGFLKAEKIERLQREFDEKVGVKRDMELIRSRVGENVEEQIGNSRLALQKLIGEIEAARVRIGDLEEQLEKLSDLEGVCPVCGTTLSEEHKSDIVSKKMGELEKLKEKIGKARKDRTATDEKIQQLEAAAGKLSDMIKETVDMDEIKNELEKSMLLLGHHTKSVDALGAQLESLKAEIGTLKEGLENATSARQRLDILSRQVKDYEEQRQKMAQLKKRHAELKEEIGGLERTASKARLDETEGLLRSLIAEEKEAEMRLVNLREMAAERSARLGEYGRTLERAQKEKDEIERLDRLTKDLKVFTEALKRTQTELRKEFVEAVNYTMNKLWQTLYPYQDFIGVRLAIEEGDYVLQLQERTTAWVNVEGAASGGERSIACLALRIAFALVLAPHLRMLVLDEPTANLDANSVKVLADTLREGIGEFIDQCFIITHDDAFEEAVTGHAYRLEREKSSDGATNVVQIN